VPYDPRFPATNQARNCYTRYNEFYKWEPRSETTTHQWLKIHTISQLAPVLSIRDPAAWCLLRRTASSGDGRCLSSTGRHMQ
jgi:hypothetical protein